MTVEDLRIALAQAAAAAASLRGSLTRLAPLFPMDGARLAALDEERREGPDALLKRFENLVNTLQDQVFRLVAEWEQARDPRHLSRRDVLDYLEKIGALDSADQFLDAVNIRNRLSHLYPADPDRQAGQFNRAYAAARVVLAALTSTEAWAIRRGITPPASP